MSASSTSVIKVEVAPVAIASEELAEQIGRLAPDLSPRLANLPVELARMTTFVESPHHDILTARLDGQIVGAAAMSLILGWTPGNTKGWLEDFVSSSDESIRGHGVGYTLWQAVESWARAREARQLLLTSHHTKAAAHKFYHRQGAKILDTSLFGKDIVTLDI